MSNTARFLLAALLFALALAVRLPSLDTFLTTDEPRWIVRSQQFALGLLNPDYVCPPVVRQGREIEAQGVACTFQTAHPGITTMWAGTAGYVLHYLLANNNNEVNFNAFLTNLELEPTPVSLIAPMRLPVAIISSLFIAIFFVIVARLFEWRLAFLAALLLAFSPFHSGLSRVLHHDSLATTFMTLSLLTMLGFWWSAWTHRWLLVSGIMAALALLSKSLALFLVPYAVFCGLFALLWMSSYKQKSAWLQLLYNGLIWGSAVLITFVVLFPAMWVSPFATLSSLLLATQDIVDRGHSHFFLGQQTSNPGWAYYPIGLFVRLSPLILLGGILAAIKTIPTIVKHRNIPRTANTGLWLSLLAYAILFLVMLSLADKKLLRYTLPVFPVFALVAARGLLWPFDLLTAHFSGGRTQEWSVMLASLLLLVVQGWFIWSTFPYYTTYYSPLMGNTNNVAKLISIIGWGEGHDLAANYFNKKNGSSTLTVSNASHETFATFFNGITKDYSYTNGNVFSSDYVIISNLQIQSGKINPAFLRYLQIHARPEHKITFNSWDYLFIYPLPVQYNVRWKNNQIEGKATLFGLSREPDSVRIYWQNDGLLADEHWWIGLQAADGESPYWQLCTLDPAFLPEQKVIEAILESTCPLPEPGLPTGAYHLRLGVGPDLSNLSMLPLPEGENALTIDNQGQLLVNR